MNTLRRSLVQALALGLVAPWAYARVLRDPRDLDVSENQKRIVALDAFFAEMLAAMGLPPVAMTMRADGTPPTHLADALGDIASVGLHSVPDYEAVIGMRPDLIVGQAARFASEASLLGSIAPTLLLNEPADDWREFMTALSDGLGRRAEAEQAISAYDRRVANMRESLASRGRRPTVLLLRVRQKDIRIYGGERRAGLVMYRDLGLEPHALTPIDNKNITISMEIMPQIDADVLLLMAEDEARMSSIEQSELWRRLPAVQAGRVHRVNMTWWNRSVGPISFGRVLDDIGKVFGLSA
ncbi:MAG: iron-siderophore ABC transporter substrate-binding protein [Halomonas sp.]|uniref:iron-siderophore ABC transporter substrate-binding protein n=1 Tax=Halomonas sp. TaxID=1486246 RepID=UPI002ACE1184|nr:iron-siderophore ABC transporter substrate-binding protein [Halomonas sp.]MDZ7851643.1 iron-siderophore ABC transporter substrate-binding protein [Halomonas sp.]